jgi:hypothetical protein
MTDIGGGPEATSSKNCCFTAARLRTAEATTPKIYSASSGLSVYKDSLGWKIEVPDL